MRKFAVLLLVFFFTLGIILDYLPADFPKEYVVFFSAVCFYTSIYLFILADACDVKGMPKYDNPPAPPDINPRSDEFSDYAPKLTFEERLKQNI